MTGSSLISTGLLAASESTSSPGFILPALIATPLIGALIIALVPRSRGDLFKPIALLTSIAAGAMSLYLLSAFEVGEAGYQFVVDQTWISRLGISFHLGVDGISLFLIVLTGLIFPIAILGAKIDHDHKAYYGWLMVLMAGSSFIGIAFQPSYWVMFAVIFCLGEYVRRCLLPERKPGVFVRDPPQPGLTGPVAVPGLSARRRA